MTISKECNEFYYLDDKGNKADADLHNYILDNEVANKAVAQATAQRMLDEGEITLELAILAYHYNPANGQ